jgi:hypothetical protein
LLPMHRTGFDVGPEIVDPAGLRLEHHPWSAEPPPLAYAAAACPPACSFITIPMVETSGFQPDSF